MLGSVLLEGLQRPAVIIHSDLVRPAEFRRSLERQQKSFKSIALTTNEQSILRPSCLVVLLSVFTVQGNRETTIWEESSGWGQPQPDFSLLSPCRSPSRNTDLTSPLMGRTCHYNRLDSRSVSITQPRECTLCALARTDIKGLCQDPATALQTGKSLGVNTNSRLLHCDRLLIVLETNICICHLAEFKPVPLFQPAEPALLFRGIRWPIFIIPVTLTWVTVLFNISCIWCN